MHRPRKGSAARRGFLQSGVESIHESTLRWWLALCVGLVGVVLNVLMVGHVGMYLSGPNLGVDYLPVGGAAGDLDRAVGWNCSG